MMFLDSCSTIAGSCCNVTKQFRNTLLQYNKSPDNADESTRCVCETLSPWQQQSLNSIKVKVKVIKLGSFESLLLLEYTC